MKKILFISNITNRITNFSLPSIVASQSLGYEFHLAANCSNFKDDASKHNVIVHHVDLDRNPFSFKNIKAYKQMLALIKEEKFDVIHCNTPIGGILGRLCGKKMRVPKIIYTAHGFHFYQGAPRVSGTIFKLAEMWMARYTDAIITMNKEDYQAALRFKLRQKGKVYFIPGVGVDTDLYKYEKINRVTLKSSLGLKESDIVLISMGDLIHRKNYIASIRAIARANNPRLQFLICGKGPELDNLQTLAKELGVENQVKFLGFRSDIKELLAISDIFLFTTYQEGLPRSMMEAMAAGLPCIASKVRGNVDLIVDEKGGFLRHPNDISGIAECISKLALNEDLRGEMKLSNLEAIKQFDVGNIKKIMKDIYLKELEDYTV
ncbi:glycosyltransferase family 4 protein [Bacillus cereus]|uniref:glycosyltransferase family 4 protein n=1 Tax=Bacillus cereus TaxID=1396 RepID=UPI001F33EFB5|nr:glycosyltransferase family 4 protein [Bacillus cereus]MCU5713803.1 glycosyltransferase family 4 protein [Bacillus cereus]BCB40345.1 glycosyl transferase family 1 [Bacillus cereus]BCC03180.1 glycosyl transferase family 1 [Bacillus cereus]BCC26696.1 glycosyl transferase family 1 [Bacillus cereus]BCC38259.1 glycosyl transferase family 1 [Bacillus cereus]